MSEENSIDLEKAEQIGTVTVGTKYYDDFLIDNVLSFNDGTENLHYHVYIPDSYDGSKPYALYITLPGYGAYYFQGVAVNLSMEHFAKEAKKYNEDMIIVAPQPNDWGETSKRQIIGLTEYMLAAYNVDSNMVYISRLFQAVERHYPLFFLKDRIFIRRHFMSAPSGTVI